MDARTTFEQVGLQVGVDGRFVGLQARFDDHLGWAYRLGMVDHWEVFRWELHAALTLVCRLDTPGDEPLDRNGFAGIGRQHRVIANVLEQARAAADPGVDWRGCYEMIWAHGTSAGMVDIPPGTPAPFGLAGTPQPIDGLPDRMYDWLLRTTFDRDMAALAGSAPLGDWSRLAPVLQRQLVGTWALNTRWTDRPDREQRQLLATRRQQLNVLLATARQHFDPATDWESFREYLWLCRERVTSSPSSAA